MIVRPHLHWFRLLFVWRGSVLPYIATRLLLVLAVSVASVLSRDWWMSAHAASALSIPPFTLMGVALAIFLGFRNSVSYDRYWEARKQWGVILVETRNLARKSLAMVGPVQEVRPFVYALAGCAATVRNHLRAESPDHGTAHLLPPELRTRLLERRHPHQQVLRWLSEWLREQRQRGTLQPVLHASLEDSLDALSMAIGSCERIASTPLPFTYSVILHRTAYFYCMLLPFGLVDAIGAMTPLVVAFVSYTFFALESLSDELEEPFGREQNDLALDAMVRTIEISMCELLDEPPPPALQPDANYVLN